MVSVIIPVFNSDSVLEETLLSIVKQKVKVDEIIIVDDCSTDDSMLIAKKIAYKFKDINWIITQSEVNSGPGNARNIGLELARNKLIAFCDSDDLWVYNKLELQLEKISEFPIVASSYKQFGVVYNKSIKLGGEYTYNDFLHDNFIPMSTVLIDYSKLCNPNLKFIRIIHEDYLYWLDLLRLNDKIKVKVLDSELMFYRIHNSNYSKGVFKKIFATYNVYKLHTGSHIYAILYLFRRFKYVLKKYSNFY